MKSPLPLLRCLSFAAGLLSMLTPSTSAQVTPLSSLDLSQIVQEKGEPRAKRSAGNHPITLAGKVFEDGFGTQAPSRMAIRFIDGVKFTATVGVDDAVGRGNGAVVFKVMSPEDKVLWQSPTMHAGDPSQAVELDLKGLKGLILVAEGDSANEANHADWADAKVELYSRKWKQVWPNTVPILKEEAVILTPKPGPVPRITGAKVFGVRPSHPLMYTITATGERPMTFAVEGLPESLQLNAQTGQLSGTLAQPGEFRMQVSASNAVGVAKRELRIVCGHQLGLVPAMGWNSWNCFGGNVKASNIKAATDAMVSTGLVNHGWNTICIDEGWNMNPRSKNPILQGLERDKKGRMLPNPNFPDMPGLVDYIHSKGLRAGIYTSPGPCACGDFAGSYEHEEMDAKLFAEWKFDYLKYDMCSYNQILAQRTRPHASNQLKAPMDPNSPEYLAELQRPWRVMRAALDQLDRDFIFSISGNCRNWGAEIGANSWRTSSDIVDSWVEIVNGWEESVCNIGFKIKPSHATGPVHCNGPELAGPGHYNDRDMLAVGVVGWGQPLHPTKLTPNEQYTHISLWCLQASPLLMGCDLTQMDEFTLGLLTNDEVLEVNQDPLGKQAVRISQEGDQEVWAKDMEDGSKAVGLFNRGYRAANVTLRWTDLKIVGQHRARDLWRQTDLGSFSGLFTTQVPRHGAVMIRLWPK